MKIKKKTKIKMEKNIERIVELILIALFISIIGIYSINNLERVVLFYPSDKQVITDRFPEFRWIDGYSQYRLIVDDDSDFSSPIINEIVYNNKYRVKEQLEFSEYYWRVIADKTESPIKEFSVVSLVSLKEKQDQIRNEGNVKLRIEERQNNWLVVGASVLDVNQVMKKKNNESLYVAIQDE